jgi:hypothetical protein
VDKNREKRKAVSGVIPSLACLAHLNYWFHGNVCYICTPSKALRHVRTCHEIHIQFATSFLSWGACYY